MELRHLRYFAALAEELNFTRAAEKVHITQSTLSHQIKQMEAELGQSLFDRDNRRVVLTEAGESLLASVTKVLREIDDGVGLVKAAGFVPSGILRVASTSTFSTGRLPGCVAAFLARHAGVRVALTELSAPGVEQAVASERVEVGIGYAPTHAGLTFEPLYVEEMILVVAVEHPLAASRRVRLVELHRQPLVLNTPDSATRRMLDEHFAAARAEPHIVAEMDSIPAILGLVRTMRVGAIVSEHAQPMTPELRQIALEQPTPLRTPGLLCKAGVPRSAACRSFIAVVRSTVSRAAVRRMPHFRQPRRSL